MEQVRKKTRSVIISFQKQATLEGKEKDKKEARESKNQEKLSAERRKHEMERRSSHRKK